MRLRLYVLLCGAALLAACPLRRTRDAVLPVQTTSRVYYDDGPAFRDSIRLVIKDINDWREVWTQATSTQASPPPLPSIDFGKDMVVLVGAGRMAPGDQIRVDSAGVRQGSFVVVVRTIVECRPFSAEAYPVEIVRVRRTERPVSFLERRDQTGECR